MITLIANNFYSLALQDVITRPWVILLVFFLLLLVPTSVGISFILLFWLFTVAQLISTIYEKRRSAKLGLQFFVLRQGPPFILTPLLEKHGAPTGEKYTEIHVNSDKKYPDMDAYNRAMQHDAELLRRLADEGRLTGLLTFNSFNRQATAALEKAFAGYPVFRKNAVCLSRVNLTGLKGKRFQKRQKKMFGRVLSHRDVGKPEEWDLLVVGPA